MTPEEISRLLEENNQPHTPMEDLPFHKWLAWLPEPPSHLVDAIQLYYGDPMRGKMNEAQVTAHRYIFQNFWWDRNNAGRRAHA